MTPPGQSYSDVRDRIVSGAVWCCTRAGEAYRTLLIVSVDDRFVYVRHSRRGRRGRLSKVTLLKEYAFVEMAE